MWTAFCSDIDLNQLVKLNHEIDPNNVKADQTILVPVGKLSERDRLILDGMGKGKYRTYPIRKGEKLSDVLSKRNITLKEFEDLNPGVDPDRLGGAALAPSTALTTWVSNHLGTGDAVRANNSAAAALLTPIAT